MYSALLNVTLTISFPILDFPLDLAEEDGQMDYTVNVSMGKKTTSTPRNTDVDLTVSAQDRPAPGGPHGSSPAPSLIEDFPTPTKLENEQQGPNVGKTALPVGGRRTSQQNQLKEMMVLLRPRGTRRAYRSPSFHKK